MCSCTHLCTHTGVWGVHMLLRVYVCWNRRVHVGTYVCAQKDTHLHMHLCWHVWVCACMSVSYVYMCTHVCTHTRTLVYMHVCAYVRVCIAQHRQRMALLILLSESRSAAGGSRAWRCGVSDLHPGLEVPTPAHTGPPVRLLRCVARPGFATSQGLWRGARWKRTLLRAKGTVWR